MNIHLNILVNFIIEEYFNDSNCLYVFTNQQISLDYHGNLPRVLIKVENSEVDPNMYSNHYGCQGFIVFHQKPATLLQNIENSFKTVDDRFNRRKYLIIIPKHSKESYLDVFANVAVNYIADIVVVNEENYLEDRGIFPHIFVEYHLFTHKYTTAYNNNDVVFVDRWFSSNKSFLHNAILYPDKLKNQQGRKFKIATFTYKPYAVVEPIDGTEVLVALEYAKKCNMTPELIADEEAEWGEIYNNWTGNGILGNIVMDKSDIGLGALYTWEFCYRFLDLSKPLVRTGITCITPAPVLLGGWITPLLAFSFELWVAVGASFLTCFLGIFVVHSINGLSVQNITKYIGKVETLIKSLLEVEGMFVLQSVSPVPRNPIGRTVYSLVLLLSLLVATIYSSGLASNLTVPKYQGVIRTAEDLAHTNMKWGATSTAWIDSIMGETRETYKTLLRNFMTLKEEKLKEYNDQKFSFSVERLHGGNFAIGNYISLEGVSRRRLMDEDLYWEHCVIMTRKNSVHLPYLDYVILWIAQTGIPVYWEERVVGNSLDTKIQRAVKYSTHISSQSSEPLSLKLDHLEGAFYLWLIGLLISSMSLFIELLVHKESIKNMRNPH